MRSTRKYPNGTKRATSQISSLFDLAPGGVYPTQVLLRYFQKYHPYLDLSGGLLPRHFNLIPTSQDGIVSVTLSVL